MAAISLGRGRSGTLILGRPEFDSQPFVRGRAHLATLADCGQEGRSKTCEENAQRECVQFGVIRRALEVEPNARKPQIHEREYVVGEGGGARVNRGSQCTLLAEMVTGTPIRILLYLHYSTRGLSLSCRWVARTLCFEERPSHKLSGRTSSRAVSTSSASRYIYYRLNVRLTRPTRTPRSRLPEDAAREPRATSATTSASSAS